METMAENGQIFTVNKIFSNKTLPQHLLAKLIFLPAQGPMIIEICGITPDAFTFL